MTVRTIDVEPAPAQAPAEGGATTNILADLRAAGDGGGGAAEATPMRPLRRISPQTIIVVMVLAASAGALYLMRRQGMQAGFRFDAIPLEKNLEKVSEKTSADERRILDDLARSTAEARVPPEKIQTNP